MDFNTKREQFFITKHKQFSCQKRVRFHTQNASILQSKLNQFLYQNHTHFHIKNVLKSTSFFTQISTQKQYKNTSNFHAKNNTKILQKSHTFSYQFSRLFCAPKPSRFLIKIHPIFALILHSKPTQFFNPKTRFFLPFFLTPLVPRP